MKGLGYFDKYNHKFMLATRNYDDMDYEKGDIYERFSYGYEFSMTHLNVDMEKIMFMNDNNEVNKVNIFLDYLTNNNKIIKDSLLNILASALILDDKLREKMTPCLILYGPSNTGKSILIELFSKIFDNKQIEKTKTVKLNNTQLFNLINKRSIIFDDVTDFNYQNATINNKIGSIIGGFVNGDSFNIKELYQQDTSAKLQLMPIIITNYRPIIETINMKRRTIFIKLSNDIDNDSQYKSIISTQDFYDEEFLTAFATILFNKLKDILDNKELNKISKNDVFNQIYHTKEINNKNKDNFDNWSIDIQNMFNELGIHSVNNLIAISQKELYEYYKQNNYGNKKIDEFINEFNINGFEFKRLNFTIHNKRITSSLVLKCKDIKEQHKIIKNMKKTSIVKYYDKNTGEIIEETYGKSQLSILNYSIKDMQNNLK